MPTIKLQFVADVKKAVDGVKTVSNELNKLNKVSNQTTKSLHLFGKVLGAISFVKLIKGLKESISNAMDMIEVANLFSVAMGDLAVETDNTLQALSKASGLDITNMRQAVGTFASLARSMGMTSKQAQVLSVNTYQLGLDLASLYNVKVADAMRDLRAGLVGQSETVYKYGIDVTEASLKAEAMNLGIQKSVRNMSQGEKMALRYAVMIKQTGLAQGDFARTIDQPANQLRILQERLMSLSRAIGSIFIPILKVILPYLNALASLLTKVAQSIAGFMGFNPAEDAKIFNTSFGGMADDSEDLDKNLDGASKKAKKLKNTVMGFDELNIMPDSTESENGGSKGTGPVAGGIDLGFMENIGYDSNILGIKSTSDTIEENLVGALTKLQEVAEPTTSRLKTFYDVGIVPLKDLTVEGLKSFYNDTLKPIGEWILGEGLPDLLDTVNSLAEDVDWNKTTEGIKKVNDYLGDLGILGLEAKKSMVEFKLNALVPLGEWAIGEGLPKLTDSLRKLTTDIDFDRLFDSFSKLGKPVGDFGIAIGDLGLSIIDVISTALSPFAEFFVETMLPDIIDGFGNILEKVSEKVKLLAEKISELSEKYLEPLVPIIEEKLNVAWDKFKEIAEDVWKNVLVPLGEIIWNLAETIIPPLWKFIKEFLIPVFEKLWEVVKELWQNVLKPLASFLYENFKGALETISNATNDLSEKVSNAKDKFKELWNKALEPIRTFLDETFLPAVENLTSKFKDFVDNVKNGFDSVVQIVNDVANGEWAKAFYGLANVPLKVINFIIGGFEKMINGVIKGLNLLIGLANKFGFDADKLSEIKLTRLEELKVEMSGDTTPNSKNKNLKLSTYATGGFPPVGELFLAKENGAELIGSINNKTGVMNNEQIVQAVATGVSRAVKEVLLEQTRYTRNEENNKPVIINLNGKEMARVLIKDLNSESTRMGFKPILRTE